MIRLILVLIFLFAGYLLMRRIRSRIWRFVILIPLFTLTFFGSMFLRTWADISRIPTPEELEAQIVESTFTTRDDLVVTVSAVGAIMPERQVPLVFQLTGPVAEILAREGERVDEGDVIARLDTLDLEQGLTDAEIGVDLQQIAFDSLTSPASEVDIAAAEAALNAARAQWGAASLSGPDESQQEIARLQTEIARNQLWQAQLQRDSIMPRLTSLVDLPDDLGVEFPAIGVTEGDVEEGVDFVEGQINDVIGQQNQAAISIARIQREQATRRLGPVEYGVDIADANYESTMARGPDMGALASANAQRIQAELALDNLLEGASQINIAQGNINMQLAELALELAQYNLAQSELTAPFAGVIARNNLVQGQLPPQDAAVLLVDDSNFYVDLPIDETDIVRIQTGQQVMLSVDALPDVELTGTITRIAYTPTRIGQLVTYNARVLLDPIEAPLRVGMSVTADVVVQEKQDVILLQNRFIRIDRATREAFVTIQTESGQFEEIGITLGERNELYSEVTGGLEVGQRVVLLPRGTATTTS